MRGTRAPIAGLLAAQAVSVTGNRIAALAIPWFVLQTTGSATRTGLAVAMNTVPAVIAGLAGGPLIERFGYRPTSVLADLASGATIVLIPVLHLAGALTYPLLLGLIFLGALLDAPGETARRSLLPDVAEHGDVSIDRASSLHETTFRLTQLLGAPLGGVLIATVGAAEALLVDAATFALSALLVGTLARVPASAPGPDPDATGPPTGYVEQLRQAWRVVLSHPLLRSTFAVFIGANLLETGLVHVLLPIISDRVYRDPVVLGLLVGAIGAGALIGVAIHAAIADRFSRRAILIPTLLLAGAPKYLLFATLPPVAVAVGGTLVLSIAMGPVNPVSAAIEYELVPRDMRGRIFGFAAVAFIGAAAIGGLTAGVAVEWFGLRATLLGGAVAYAIVTLVPAVHPAWRDLDRLTPAPAPD